MIGLPNGITGHHKHNTNVMGWDTTGGFIPNMFVQGLGMDKLYGTSLQMRQIFKGGGYVTFLTLGIIMNILM